MTETTLQLGPITFQNFETPERIATGGEQRLTIHRLPGGTRIIDAMGRDDSEIAFSGIVSGPDASARAASLDTLRASGAVLPLSWDVFVYSVVISKLELEFRSPWWIPFRLVCTVLRDESAAFVGAAISLAADLVADLAGAASPALAGGIDLAASSAAVAAPSAAVPGTADSLAANLAVGSATSSLSSGIAAQQSALVQPADLASGFGAVVGAAGSLANLLAARAYLARAAANLASAGG